MPSVTFPMAGTVRSGRHDGASSVGARLAVRRVHCGLSVSALAHATGLSEDSIIKAEGGTLDLGEANFGAMARVLGLPPEDLFRPSPAGSDSERSLEVALARRIASIRDETVRLAVIALVTTVAAAGEARDHDAGAQEAAVAPQPALARGRSGRKASTRQ